MELENIINKVSGVASNITDKLSDWKTEFLDEEKQNIIRELQDNGRDKMYALLNELENSSSLLSDIGYQFTSFSIDLGIPPSVKLSFKVIPIVNEMDVQSAISESNPILKIVLNALLRTNSLSKNIQIGTFKCQEVGLVLGLMPDIALTFRREEA